MAARKNIVFILSDDQGAWALGCGGNPEIKTPHLDQLAGDGLRFSNFFCVSPVCSPARASILTGRIPSAHGVHDWIRRGNLNDPKGAYAQSDRATQYLKDIPGTTDFLAGAGYHCGLSGKWHLGDSLTPQKGFSFWNAYAFGGGNYFDYKMCRGGKVSNHTQYVTEHFTDGALEFLDLCQKDPRPFYLSVHYTAPHSPWDPANHPKEWLDLYPQTEFHSTPCEPTHPWQTLSAPVGHTPELRAENLRGYYGAISAMDQQIGRILNRLKEMGEYENTLIVFSGDNGMNMGHHGLWGKGNASYPMNMFEESVKVPFIVKAPGGVKGQVEGGLWSHYDVLPTLLDWAGLGEIIPQGLPGRSFAPLFRGLPANTPDEVVVFDEYGPVRMIRSGTWKYVHRFPDGPHELYDLARDPGERKNLLQSPTGEMNARQREMKNQLEIWFAKYATPEKDGLKLPVAGSGQLGLVGANQDGALAFHEKPKVFSQK